MLQGCTMPETDSGQPRPLPDALERALQQATGRTLKSLASLRRALREHVRSERSNGITLTELEVELRALVARAETQALGLAGSEQQLRTSLSNQVVTWSESYFSRAD